MSDSGVSTKHPDYLARQDEWRLMRDAADGSSAIKDAGETYLPRPGGFGSDSEGNALYAAYKARARFPDILSPSIAAMVGVIHQAEHKIEMPDQMQPLWERATADGLPLEAFHRRITAELLGPGRYAVLADASSSGDMPWLAGYRAEALINWSDDRTMFVLDESGLVRDGFRWEQQEQYLALTLENGVYTGRRYDAAGEIVADSEVTPQTAGRSTLDLIPLVVIGPKDLAVSPEQPPLIGVAQAAIAMYQLSADYRWQLFMSGQETLFVINGDLPDRVGAGVAVALKGGEGIEPDAKYVGPTGTGIEAHRLAIQDEAKAAGEAGARLFNVEGDGRSQESGEARKLRYAAETASLLTVAQASCAGLERALRHAGRLMGLSDAELAKIVVTPPLALIEREMTPDRIAAITGLWEKGLISGETAYENLRAGGVTSSERTWEDEQKLIDAEDVASQQEKDAARVGG